MIPMFPDQLPIIPSCEGCGACCSHMGSPPFDVYEPDGYDHEDIEFETLPIELQRELDEAWESGRAIASAPCIWLDLETRKCKHYEYRPVVCRRFRPGNDICWEDREIDGIGPAAAKLAPEVVQWELML